jgi:hypothetical protein
VKDGRRELPSVLLGERDVKAVRILSRLARDLERFDLVIDRQRDTLERPGGPSGRDDDAPAGLSTVRLEASELAVRTRRALDELRRLTDPIRARPRRPVPRGSCVPAPPRGRHR